MIAGNDFQAINQSLIRLKPQSLGNISEVADLLSSNFKILFGALREGNGTDDSVRLILTDGLGIWLLRCRQLLEINLDSEEKAVFVKELRNEVLTFQNCAFLFHYVIDFWNEGGAALSNSLSDLFAKLIQLMKAVHGTSAVQDLLLNDWLSQTLEIPSTMRVLYYLLTTFAGEIDMVKVIEQSPSFVDRSLASMWTESLATPIGKCVASLLINIFERHYRDEWDKWFELWEMPTMRQFQDVRTSKRIETCVIVPIFKLLPDGMFERFVSRNFNSESPELIPFLRIGQELGIEEEPYDNDRLVSIQFVEHLLQSNNSKLAAFELLTYSTKKSRAIPHYIYAIIRRNIHSFFVDVEVKVRNAFHSVLKHFLDRVRDSTYSLNRDMAKLRSKNIFPNEQAEKQEKINEAFEFLEWLFKFLKTQLAPGSQYQRKILAGKILKTLIASSLDPNIKKAYLDPRMRMKFPFAISMSEDDALKRLLIDNLTDDYNDVRDICLELLIVFSDSGCCSEIQRDGVLFSRCLQLMKSYKGCNGGAKIAEYLTIVSQDKESSITVLLEELAAKIYAFKTSFNGKEPVNGFFQAIGLMLAAPTVYTCLQHVNDVIDKCIDLITLNWDSVKFILCDEPFEVGSQDKCLKVQVSDPLVISYAFRSIKESAELFQSLIAIPSLSNEQLIACGRLMLDQLSRIRHSGAFQSLIPSFVACCKRCSTDVPNELNVWLGDMLNMLGTKTQFITRRSGGIPHIICSIVSCENQKTGPILTSTFDKLFSIAQLPLSGHEEQMDLPQVNAFNCIKVLFVESPLSSACAPFVYRTLVLCLESFNSPLWSLRNCSFMLFSALQNRLFGKTGKSISARLFFTRFNGVREILLDQLRSSLKSSLQPQEQSKGDFSSSGMDSQIVSIFLVLTVLSRLKQTPGYHGLKDFEDLVTSCLSSQNWTLRQLAARILPGLVEDHEIKITSLLESLLSPNLSQNYVHGCTLAISALINTSLEVIDEFEISENILRLACSGVEKHVLKNPCFVSAKAYIELLHLIFDSSAIDFAHKSLIIAQLGTLFVNLNSEYHIDGTRQLLLRSLLSLLLRYESSNNLLDVLLLALYSPYFKLQIAAAQYICSNTGNSMLQDANIEEALFGILHDKDSWDYVRLFVLKALIKLEKEVDTEILMSMVLDAQNDDLRAVALEYLGLFVDAGDLEFEKQISVFSRDESPFELRKSALASLINLTKRTSSSRSFLLISQYLYDDELELRTMSADHLNQYYLELQNEQCSTAFPVTAKLFIEKVKRTPQVCEELGSMIMDTLRHQLADIEFRRYAGLETELLFEVEPENQFRNKCEEGLRSIEMLEFCAKQKTEAQALASELIDRIVTQMNDLAITDSPTAWGSDPKLFTQLVLLRKLARQFKVTNAEALDATLSRFECHPLVFELSS